MYVLKEKEKKIDTYCWYVVYEISNDLPISEQMLTMFFAPKGIWYYARDAKVVLDLRVKVVWTELWQV